MKRLIPLLAWLTGLAPSLDAASLAPEADKPSLTSVISIGQDVYAATHQKLYRASREVRKWQPTVVPASLPLGGNFVSGPTGSGEFYYFAIRDLGATEPVPSAWVYGLYRRPAGADRWVLVSAPENFHNVTIYGTNFYAIAGPGPNSAAKQRILRSFDRGRTWVSLSEHLPDAGYLMSFFPDPDHPGLVCIRAHGLRGYIVQANDETYRWRTERETVWERRHPSEARFFAPRYSIKSQLPMLVATLNNYFDWPFGDSVQLPGLCLSIGGARTFSVGASLTLPVELSYRAESPAGALVDWRDEKGCWALRRITPLGAYESFGPKTGNPPESFGPRGIHPLSRETRYHRTVDLNALADFREVGRYRVQLIYTTLDQANRLRGEWPVEVGSPVLEVEIQP